MCESESESEVRSVCVFCVLCMCIEVLDFFLLPMFILDDVMFALFPWPEWVLAS